MGPVAKMLGACARSASSLKITALKLLMSFIRLFRVPPTGFEPMRAAFELLSGRAPGGTTNPAGEISLESSAPTWGEVRGKIVRERRAAPKGYAVRMNWPRKPSMERKTFLANNASIRFA
jgi:hypothetical protein